MEISPIAEGNDSTGGPPPPSLSTVLSPLTSNIHSKLLVSVHVHQVVVLTDINEKVNLLVPELFFLILAHSVYET